MMSKARIRNPPLLLLHPFVSNFDTLFAKSPLVPVRLLRLPALCGESKAFHIGSTAEEKIQVAASGHAKLTASKGAPCYKEKLTFANYTEIL